MDEMVMVRELLAQPPPDPHVVAKGRERLFGASARSARRIPPTVTTPTTRRAAFRSAVGLGLTGAVAAAVLAVAVLMPGVSTPPQGTDPAPTDGSVRNVLLAAAERAESAPTSGTYWHVRSMSRATLSGELGRGENRYTVEVLSVHEAWTKRAGQTWWGQREWVRPKSAEDTAAWRRDGSPSKWCRGTTDTEPPVPNCLHAAPGTAWVDRIGENSFGVSEGEGLTYAQLQQLPAEADALRDWVVDRVKDDLDEPLSRDILDFNVAEVLANLLVDAPAPPEVRAAAYRALADMPNVESLGATRDELGRRGVGITIVSDSTGVFIARPSRERFDSGEFARTLIIDPETSQVLASAGGAKGSDPLSATLILEVGWTNEKPHEPEMP